SRIVFAWMEEEYAISVGADNISHDIDLSLERALRAKNIFHQIAWFPPRIDLAVPLVMADNFLREEIMKIKTRFDRPPENPRIFISEGIPSLEDGVQGRCLDVNATEQEAVKRLYRGQTSNIPIKAEIIDTTIKSKNLPDISNLLSEYKTSLDEIHANAVNNISIALDSMNGAIIKPGETFSFNQIVGPVTSDRGYRETQIMENYAETIVGIGGGLNQLATTVYQSSLLAGLEIIERHPHGGQVSYISLGLGATVNYSSRDLVIKNTYKHPILLVVSVENDALSAKYYGAPGPESAYTVKIVGHIVETITPIKFEQEAPGLPAGQTEIVQEARDGHRVEVFRVLYEGNKEVGRELISEDLYQPVNEIVRIGTKR
ncbi:MAG: hypothetical protein GX887_06380, partial [Firmicutes bacterium]|nr:hypothetical protein [Bacillota bacterium]